MQRLSGVQWRAQSLTRVGTMKNSELIDINKFTTDLESFRKELLASAVVRLALPTAKSNNIQITASYMHITIQLLDNI